MSFVLDRPQSALDPIPAMLVLQRPADEPLDEGAALAFPDPTIQLAHDLIVEAYV